VTGPAVHVVASNIKNQTLGADGRIEVAFDSYLLPACITRQTFQLHDLSMRYATPTVAYDPVARVVTITPTAPLAAGVTYALTITSSTPDPTVGLRAIDGATIAPADSTIEFSVVPAGSAAPQATPPTVDFCKDIFPILTPCAGAACHGATPPGPAAGLRLDSTAAIDLTAVGRAAQGANTGARAARGSAGLHFGVDMPLIDPGGDPGNSWLLYKLLLAIPTPPSSTNPGSAGCDGGTTTPTDVSGMHLVSWQPPEAQRVSAWLKLHDSLSNYVQGREMPFPSDPNAPIDQATAPLTVDQLERISRWIAQPTNGAPLVPATCDCAQ